MSEVPENLDNQTVDDKKMSLCKEIRELMEKQETVNRAVERSLTELKRSSLEDFDNGTLEFLLRKAVEADNLLTQVKDFFAPIA
jgi:hypothetical protein